MKANPGGQIDSKAVVGRDKLIQNLWETLEQRSLLITSERRIGKTTVIKKMRDDPLSGWLPVYKEIHKFLSAKGKAARRAQEWLSAIGGIEIRGVFKLPEQARARWKEVLTRSIEDLIHENEGDTQLLFFWDEIPYMLANIRDREGEQTAMDVLDLLRGLRQTHCGFRMAITGSIGLHHVLDRERLRNLLRLMERDHYLKRDENERYQFRFPLIRRWWKINRGL